MRNISQSKLAELSGVSIRAIKSYEQGAREINKTQGISLYKLTVVLIAS